MGVRVSEIGELGRKSEGCRYQQAGHAFRCDTPIAHGLTRQARQSEFNKNLCAVRTSEQRMAEPVRTIALLCVSFGLRISECLALKWSDVDWLASTLQVVRGIVRQRVGPVKPAESEKPMAVDSELLSVLGNWKQ